ncbi:hypothetical protein [Streptomyces canus]|uniref:hypothetical protein n=1 Tax=Streptomyces canus TaxID=58343 RepID=UPI003CF270C0
MPGFGVLVDDFDDGVRDPAKWSGSYGAVEEGGGRARVPCTTGFSGYASAPQYSLAGSAVACRVYPPAAGGAAGEALAELFVLTPTAGTDVGFSANVVSGQLSCLSRGGFFDPAPVTVAYSPAVHAWLRLREADGVLRWETSADGRTWTTRRTIPSPAWVDDGDLAVVLAAHRDSGTSDFAAFDDFNLTRARMAGAARTGSSVAPLVRAGSAMRGV